MGNITITRTTHPKPKPVDENKLAFGRQFTDHMFLMNYTAGTGWHDARIVPYGPISLDPAATCLHYGQLVFEGMKAYRTEEGKAVLFRPHENMKRINVSSERLCIPAIDVDFMVGAISKLVEIEQDWIPHAPGTSLYIRPFILSTDAFLGVNPAKSYLFVVILSPVGPYYKEGLKPVRIYVENHYARAVRGGTGYTKSAGNYAASLRAQVEAEEQGYSQVLWLDSIERKYVEEVGAMNVFFVIDGVVVTPELNGNFLPGITRKSVIEVLKNWNVPIEERPLPIAEIAQAHKDGKLQEAFGTGTAAVISPIGELKWDNHIMHINNNEIGPISQRLYDEITGIQNCKKEDPFGWVFPIPSQS